MAKWLMVVGLLLVAPGFSLANDLKATSSETMTQKRLHEILSEQAQDIDISDNVVSLTYNQVEMICISDAAADRMRIFSPIALVTDVSVEMLLTSLAANYHSTLDARYAIGNGTVYSTYIHPLSPITEQQVISALRQVAGAKTNFGSTYSSDELFFPGQGHPESSDQEIDGTAL